MEAKRDLLFASSIVWVVCLWSSQIRPAIKTQTRFNAGYVSIYFQEDPSVPPPKKKKKIYIYIYQISNAKKAVCCHLRCQLIGLTNKNVWPTTAGMISFLLLTLDGHFKTPLIVLLSMLQFSGLVLMGINWQIPPSGRKEDRLVYFVFTNIVY